MPLKNKTNEEQYIKEHKSTFCTADELFLTQL